MKIVNSHSTYSMSDAKSYIQNLPKAFGSGANLSKGLTRAGNNVLQPAQKFVKNWGEEFPELIMHYGYMSPNLDRIWAADFATYLRSVEGSK